MEIWIGVARKSKWRQARLTHCYRELLAEFSYQGIFRPLAILDLAAWEFPETGHRLALRSLRNQHAAICIDERASGNEDDLERQDAGSGSKSDSRR